MLNIKLEVAKEGIGEQTMSTLQKLPDAGSYTERAKTLLKVIRNTNDSKILGVVRLLLGGLFVMTGLMKLFIPMLGAAFSVQLLVARIPFYSFNIWFVPIAEVVIGAFLLVGLFSRIGALVANNIMLVAIYVHLVVDNPAVFPLQPQAPIIPLVAIAIAIYVVWRGGGAWSADYKISQ